MSNLGSKPVDGTGGRLYASLEREVGLLKAKINKLEKELVKKADKAHTHVEYSATSHTH